MENIDRLTKAGTMVAASLFIDPSGPDAAAGLFILRAASLDAAKDVAQSNRR
jgi:hypothetical protein